MAKRPKVTISSSSGFCFGVVYAVEMAEAYLAEHPYLYCLGDIVHNDEEVKRLQAKGLRIISHNDLSRLQGETVLIRAHGEPPETYAIALQNNIHLLDASCPVVLKLQNRIREIDREGVQIVLLGTLGHPEVIGLVGQIQKAKLFIVSSPEDVEALSLDPEIPTYLFSQTTKAPALFSAVREALLAKVPNAIIADTLCRQVSNREPHLMDFARSQDVVLFVGGKKSSNGKALFSICQAANPRSYYISIPQEINWEWLEGAERIGIAGATSTPHWLMERVKAYIEAHYESEERD
ncbi:MAG: 4-hydroxy-3-methylbut-2-enyl diphosphate reductase [Bacteroidia bacterium]|nr:4-hydroxy-3-methylbut-2-enyl diphosphate reductase [Bacteroidia bacterium]MDW8133482.1 4-hydroxy-3-methylbut-2-enyl diphosphate reductase [Bacteroidia bacterium]